MFDGLDLGEGFTLESAGEMGGLLSALRTEINAAPEWLEKGGAPAAASSPDAGTGGT
jgi:hypothetical protein